MTKIEQVAELIIAACETNPELRALLAGSGKKNRAQVKQTKQAKPSSASKTAAARAWNEARRAQLLQADLNGAEREKEILAKMNAVDAQRGEAVARVAKLTAAVKAAQAELKALADGVSELDLSREDLAAELEALRKEREAVWREWNERGFGRQS